MRLGFLLCTLSLVVAQGTTRPDFSGTWTYVEAGSTVLQSGARAPTFGREFIAKQAPVSLTIVRPSTQNQTPIETTFQFDGSETVSRQPGGAGQPDVKILSTASWNGVIFTTRSVLMGVVNGTFTNGEVVRSIRLNNDGTMVIESENRLGPTPDVAKLISIYRKK